MSTDLLSPNEQSLLLKLAREALEAGVGAPPQLDQKPTASPGSPAPVLLPDLLW
jgi:hypothetical protein